jgi:quercetin dioxygenase-like cupin family protein
MSSRSQFLWGVLAGASVMALLPSVAALRASEPAASPSANAPASASKVVLENSRVRVKDVTFAAGVADAPMHTHALPHVGVILTAGTLVFSEPGKPAEVVHFDVGSVGYREANVTHRATNPGPTPMRVIEVELK